MMIMIKSNASNEDLDRQNISLRDVRSFSIIIFMVSLMAAAIINTQAGMKPIASVLAFFALANLIVGIAAQLIRMRK
jgi:small-conductance mechanosensitive channel